MKKVLIYATMGVLVLSTLGGCKKYLNVNSDPDTTQTPSNSSAFPAVLAAMPYGMQRDARYIAKYIQNWNASGTSNNDVYDRHGYTFIDNNMGDLWWMGYFMFGKNTEYMQENAIKKNQPDYAGAVLALKAWAFQSLIDEHDYIIFDQAWKDGVYYFTYDSAARVYKGIDSLCRMALGYLDQAAGKSDNTLGLGDFVYKGDIAKWKKFTYGILARNYNHQSNKTNYSTDSVIKFCDLSMAVADDDFVVPFDATTNDNSNFWGTFRNNLGSVRQSNYIVKLLDGTILAGNSNKINRDPRLAYMLSASQDTSNGNGGYRGVDPGVGDPNVGLTGSYAVGSTNWINARKRVAVLWGDSLYANPSSGVFTGGAGKFLFRDKVVMPVMTSSEIQFMKAEAAYKKGLKSIAYTAYRKGISLHFDMINRGYAALRGNLNLYSLAAIPGSALTTYLASANVKQDESSLRLSDIMTQKYIALWGWGFLETWTDLRRYKYTDKDPDDASMQVFRNFTLPGLGFVTDNLGRPALRIRPNYRSEYQYNYSELLRIGADKTNWHTLDFWPSRQ